MLEIRSAFLMALVVCLGGNFVAEQPKSSLLFECKRMKWLCSKLKARLAETQDVNRMLMLLLLLFLLLLLLFLNVLDNMALAQVYRVSIWMGNFLSDTPKPTLLWSSTPAIRGFWSSRRFQ